MVLSAVSPWQNGLDPYDVNAGTYVTPLDALILVNEIHASGEGVLPATYSPTAEGVDRYVDVDGDQSLGAADFSALAASFGTDASSLPPLPSATLVPIPTPTPSDPPSNASPSASYLPSTSTAPTPSYSPSSSYAPTPSQSYAPTPSQSYSPTPSYSYSPTPSCGTTAPYVSVTDGTTDEGVSLSPGYSAGISGPSECATAAIESVTVKWGDDSSDTYDALDDDGNPIAFSPSHMYADDEPDNPAENYTNLTFSVTVNWTGGSSASGSGTITVRNVPPVPQNDTGSTYEDLDTYINVTSNDTDVAADILTYAAGAKSAKGATITQIAPGYGLFKYDPRGVFCLANDETTTDTFSYTVHDDDDPSQTKSATVTVTVTGRRETYYVGLAIGGDADEEGQHPAELQFTIKTVPTCHPVSVEYGYDVAYPRGFDDAEPADFSDGLTGTITWNPGDPATKTKNVIPNNDTVVERNEVMPMKVMSGMTGNYFVWPSGGPTAPPFP